MQAVPQAPQLLLAQLHLVLQLPLLDSQRRCHAHKMLIVLQLLAGQAARHAGEDQALPLGHVLLQLLGVLQLRRQLPLLLHEGQLEGEPKRRASQFQFSNGHVRMRQRREEQKENSKDPAELRTLNQKDALLGRDWVDSTGETAPLGGFLVTACMIKGGIQDPLPCLCVVIQFTKRIGKVSSIKKALKKSPRVHPGG